MFETFGLTRMAELAGWLLIAAAIGGYGLVAQHLHRSGFASPRLVVLMPIVAVGATLVYGALAAWFALRSPEATLNLTLAAFLVGSVAFALLSALPIFARDERLARFLAAYGRFLILGYAPGMVVLVGSLLLSVLGLA